MACKKYRNDRSREDFHMELRNLEYLKADIGQGKRSIMLHIASIVHGDDFMILLPLAELRDLEVFLRCGFEAQDYTREEVMVYDFDREFPSLTPSILQGALFKELLNIASALVWLHEDLHIQGSLDIYCAHMDLKPENILVTRGSGSPVGKWMISDFGISILDQRTDRLASNIRSIRDVGHRLTSNARQDRIDRGHGPYQPPEIDNPRVDGRKCDIWSFACILADVLKFALEGTVLEGKHALKMFRDERFHGGDDFFYKTKDGLSIPTIRDSSNTELKGTILAWLDSLSSNPTFPWVRQCGEMLREVLVIDPAHRLGARGFMEKVHTLLYNIASEPGSNSPVNDIVVLPPPASNGRIIHPSIEALSNPDDERRNSASTGSIFSIPSVASGTPHSSASSPIPSMGLTLPFQGRIRSVDLSANGEYIALLYTDRVDVHPISNNQGPIPVPLPSESTWTKICLAFPFLAVYGLPPSSAQKSVSHLASQVL